MGKFGILLEFKVKTVIFSNGYNSNTNNNFDAMKLNF